MTVDIGRIAFASREYRKLKVEDLSVQTRRPLATEMEYNTYLANPADATVFGGFILSLLKMDRYNWSMRVVRENYDFEIGDTIVVRWPRYGLDLGEEFIVKRIRDDVNNPFVEVALFGPRKRSEAAAMWLDFAGSEFWQNGSLLSSITSSEGYIFSRAGEIGALNSDGTVTWFASGVPAINGYGYHVYSAITSSTTHSQDFFNAWTKNQTVGAGEDVIAAPDGSMTADLVNDTNVGSVGSANMIQNYTVPAIGPRTQSIFVKRGTYDHYMMRASAFSNEPITPTTNRFDLVNKTMMTQTGAVGFIKELADDWLLISINFTLVGPDLTGQFGNFLIDGDTNSSSRDGRGLYFWQGQSIDILASEFPPLVRTTTAAVTVPASGLEIAASLPDGDFIAWAIFNIETVGASRYAFAYSTAGAGTSNERLAARLNGSHFEFQPRAGGATQPGPTTISSVFNVGRNMALIGRRNGKYFSAVRKTDGTLIIRDDASGTGVVPAVTAVDIGTTHDGSGHLNGHVEGFFQLNGTYDNESIAALTEFR